MINIFLFFTCGIIYERFFGSESHSSTNGIDLYFPCNDPDRTLHLIFWVDLILICHLQSLDRDPLVYSCCEQFLRLVREKHEHLMHVRDSSVAFHPVKAAYALIISYSGSQSAHVESLRNILLESKSATLIPSKWHKMITSELLSL